MTNDRNSVREYLAKIGKKGGEMRAARHSRATLSRWGKLGGRPRKKKGSKIPGCQNFAAAAEKHLKGLFFIFDGRSYWSGKHQDSIGRIIRQSFQRTFPALDFESFFLEQQISCFGAGILRGISSWDFRIFLFFRRQ